MSLLLFLSSYLPCFRTDTSPTIPTHDYSFSALPLHLFHHRTVIATTIELRVYVSPSVL